MFGNEEVCGKIENVFTGRGFKRVITPFLEFYDVFTVPNSGITQESMFKSVDNKGRLLVARPILLFLLPEWFPQDLTTAPYRFAFIISRLSIATIPLLQAEETSYADGNRTSRRKGD